MEIFDFAIIGGGASGLFALQGLKEKKVVSKANLKVVDNTAIKTTSYSDINLKQWRDYEHIKTDTLWEFPNRLKEGGHSNEYHGNYIPQIATQLLERYTKKGDVVLDLFLVC